MLESFLLDKMSECIINVIWFFVTCCERHSNDISRHVFFFFDLRINDAGLTFSVACNTYAKVQFCAIVH